MQALEAVRYYHSEGRITQLGGGSMLVTAVDAYDDGDGSCPAARHQGPVDLPER